MPRGKIAYLAASFRHIDACARGEIPIVAAPPPFPTRDFLPWRFSAAGRRSAWRDHHPAAENLGRSIQASYALLMHVLPSGFHRIRYYGFLTCQTRAKNIERIRELLAVPLIPLDDIKAASAKISTSAQPEEPKAPEHPCPCCGSNMRIIETFLRGQQPKHKPTPVPPKIRIDTS